MYFVDSNILIDVIQDDPAWAEDSARALEICASKGEMIINPIVFAEVSMSFSNIDECRKRLHHFAIRMEPIIEEAAFLAGKAFLLYRRKKGQKTSPLPDFFIGAHAAVREYTLLTRDAKRYKTYFPKLSIMHP